MSIKTSKGVRSFGIENVVKHVVNIMKYYDYCPLVSVGSGNGYLEKAIEDVLPKKKIICIDPNPLSFYKHSEIYKKPEFSYVKDLIKKMPSIVGECVLLLNWCNPNNSIYDYEAILNLQPKGFVSIVEVFINDNGAAGGKKFFDILKYVSPGDFNPKHKLTHEIIDIVKKYKCLHKTELEEKQDFEEPSFDQNDIRIYCVGCPIKGKEISLPNKLPCLIKNDGYCCIM